MCVKCLRDNKYEERLQLLYLMIFDDMIIVFKTPQNFLEGVQWSNFFLYIAGIFPEIEERTNDP